MLRNLIICNLFLFFLSSPVYSLELRVLVNLETQKMVVKSVDGDLYVWDVSSGKAGYSTPKGQFKPVFLSKNHRSTIYNNARMDNSIFFNGNVAIHGTEYEDLLGEVASHGCVRISLENSEILFNLVEKYGIYETLIEVK